MFSKRISWNDNETITTLTNALRQGRIIAGTTDTVIGLLAPLTDEGRLLLDEIKGRSNKPYLILIGSLRQAYYFVAPEYLKPYQALLAACWPGPLTVIFKAKKSVPSYLVSPEGTIALRVPDHTGLQHVLQSLKGLFSTSANRAGDPIPATLDQIDATIKDRAAYIVAESGCCSAEKVTVVPSTILDCSQEQPRIIRQGACPANVIATYLDKTLSGNPLT